MSLAEAVHNRQLVSFTYDGLPRVVQPATYGVTTTGKLSLRGCLVDGKSNRNTIPCWELYTEAKMSALTISDSTFENFACEGYTRDDSAFVTITAEH